MLWVPLQPQAPPAPQGLQLSTALAAFHERLKSSLSPAFEVSVFIPLSCSERLCRHAKIHFPMRNSSPRTPGGGEKHSSRVLSLPTAGADATPAITEGTGRGDSGQMSHCRAWKTKRVLEPAQPCVMSYPCLGAGDTFQQQRSFAITKSALCREKTQHQQLPQIPAGLRQERCRWGAAGAEHH